MLNMAVVVWFRSRLGFTDWRRSVPMSWEDARALVDGWRASDPHMELEIHTAPRAGAKSPPVATA